MAGTICGGDDHRRCGESSVVVTCVREVREKLGWEGGDDRRSLVHTGHLSGVEEGEAGDFFSSVPRGPYIVE